jgi:uncharacterized OB-fold protein
MRQPQSEGTRSMRERRIALGRCVDCGQPKGERPTQRCLPCGVKHCERVKAAQRRRAA